MAAEAEAAREARAKVMIEVISLIKSRSSFFEKSLRNATFPFQVVAAEGEMKASRALKEAADVLSENAIALQLRHLQCLNSIAAEHNSTIVFPVPIDILGGFLKKDKWFSPPLHCLAHFMGFA